MTFFKTVFGMNVQVFLQSLIVLDPYRSDTFHRIFIVNLGTLSLEGLIKIKEELQLLELHRNQTIQRVVRKAKENNK